MVEVNYDLIEKIKELKKGICLYKDVRFSMSNTIKITLLFASFLSLSGNFHINTCLGYVVGVSLGDLIYNIVMHKYLINKKKDEASKALRKLIYDLDINTDLELLSESEEYESYTNPIKKFPFLKEKKYIIVPTFDGEVSLLQEHIIGHDKYTISFGTPEKKLKLVKVNA